MDNQIDLERGQLDVASLDRPTVPSRLRAEIYSLNSAEIFWEASLDNNHIAGYEIHRDGAYLRSGDFRSLFESDLQPGRSYAYQVRAFDNEGNFSDFSETLIVQLPTIPGEPLLNPAADEVPAAPINTPVDETPNVVEPEIVEIAQTPAEDTQPTCLLYTSPSPRDKRQSRMPSSA